MNKSKSSTTSSNSSPTNNNINENKENSKPVGMGHSISASMMSLDDSNIAFSESSQDGSNSIVSQSLMDTNDNSNLTNGQSLGLNLLSGNGNSESAVRHIAGTSSGGTSMTTNKPPAPNLSALLENSTDAQFPDNYDNK